MNYTVVVVVVFFIVAASLIKSMFTGLCIAKHIQYFLYKRSGPFKHHCNSTEGNMIHSKKWPVELLEH